MLSKFKLSPLSQKRLNAFLIDLFFVFVLTEITVKCFTMSAEIIFYRFPFQWQMFLINDFPIFKSTATLAIFFTYFSLFFYLTEGRTPGGVFMGIRIYSKKFELSLMQCILRTISYLLNIYSFGLLLAPNFFHKNNQGLVEALSQTETDYELKNHSYLLGRNEDSKNYLHSIPWQLSFFDQIDFDNLPKQQQEFSDHQKTQIKEDSDPQKDQHKHAA